MLSIAAAALLHGDARRVNTRIEPVRTGVHCGTPDSRKPAFRTCDCRIDDVSSEDSELTASFDGRTVIYGFGELDTLVPAYAATFHKSQGSEYPAVVNPVMTQHCTMLQRNLLYTGVTRGKKLVVLVGQKKAVAIAVRNVSGRSRWSKLNEWLASRTVSTPIR